MELCDIIKGLSESRNCGYKFSFDFTKPPITLVNSLEYSNSVGRSLGLSMIGKCALVILAGGCGTRLNINKPKLLINIKDNLNLLTLFLTRVIDRRLEASISQDIKTHIFILTSSYTKNLIEEHVQTHLLSKSTTIDTSGLSIEIITQNEIQCHDLSFKPLNITSPNGNGGLFEALESSKTFWNGNFEYIHVIGSDNILSDPLDPIALSVFISERYNNSPIDALLKCIETNSPIVGIIAIKIDDNHQKTPYIVEYSEMVDHVANQKVKYGNICDHIFRTQFVKDFIASKKHVNMPWHLAKKTAAGHNGALEVYKLEKFIFDIIHHSNNVVAYVIPSKEFAPIKRMEDLDPNDPKSSLCKYFSGINIKN